MISRTASSAAIILSLGVGFGCGRGLSFGGGNGAGGNSGILPNSVPGLRVWLRADSLVTIATGVSNWGDKSGYANDFAQATAGNQPTAVAADSGFGNQPVIQFDGANHYLSDIDGDNGFSGQEAAWIAVFATDPAQPAGTILSMGTSGVAALNDGWRMDVAQSGGAYVRGFGLNAGAAVSTPDTLTYSLGAATAAICLWTQATSLDLFLGVFAAGFVNAPDPITGGAFYKMSVASHNFVPGFYFKGKIAEIIVYNRYLTLTETLGIGCYIQKRYGISLGSC